MGEVTLAFVGSLNREAPYFQGARGEGIAVLRYDEATGRLEPLSVTGGIDNPTFLTVDAARRTLYATSEVFGWNEGTVTAYRIDAAAGTLHYINKQPTEGSITAYCAIDRSGRHLLVANYAHGIAGEVPGHSVVALPIREDGGLGPIASSRTHEGSGPDPVRQTTPHAHCAVPAPDGTTIAVADLGIDAIISHRFDAETGRFTGEPAGRAVLPPGAGPRHLVFHPSGRFAYVVAELGSAIYALAADPAGGLSVLHSLPMLPEGFTGTNHCADIHLTPDGRFLYASNRGHDSIACFAVDAGTGHLSAIGHHPSGGSTPRNFAVDPAGRFLLVANQNGDTIVTLAIDQATGTLSDTGHRLPIGTPMCVKLARFAI